MKKILITLAVLSVAGCAALVQTPRTEAQPVTPFAEAERLAEQRNYEGARRVYQRLAGAEAGSSVAEEALYRSARVLLVSENPAKNYILAARELEALLQLYPSGRFARDAADWLAALNAIPETKVKALLEQIDEYEKKAIASGNELRKAEAGRDKAITDNDALAAERDELKGRIDSLVRERDQLLLNASALRQEQSGLVKDKGTLAKKVEVLMKEKEKLLAAKAKLEKRLRDITEVDIKMERERKKMK